MSGLRVLTVGPLPPPPGGMASVVEGLHNAVSGEIEHRVFDVAKKTREGRTLVEGILAQLSLIAAYLWLLASWRPHVVHIHTCSGFTFWRNVVDILLARLFLRPVFVHIHGGRFDRFLDALDARRAGLVRWVFRRCSLIIVLGPLWARLLTPWAGGTPMHILPNGVPVPADVAGPSSVGRVVCVGLVEPAKGQRELLQALVRLSRLPWELVFVGPVGDEGYRQAILEEAGEAGVAGRVRFTGALDSQRKDGELERASVFALASHDEALPMSMLEAMALAVPVVMTRVGSIPDVIEHGDNGFMAPARDVPALARVLEPLLADRSLREKIGGRGRDTVIACYSRERIAGELLQLYDRFRSA